jgi:AcrR family transcriptional regulator
MTDNPRDVILAASLKLVGEQGISGTSMADIASATGVSRATLYRYFPGGKDEVMEATVAWEQTQFLLRIRDAIDGSPDLVTLLVRALRVGRREIETHVQLQRLLATEPERLYPLFFRSNQLMVRSIARYLAPLVAASSSRPDLDVAWAADEIARMYLQYVEGSPAWNLDDPRSARNFVERYLLAALR